MQKLIFIKNIPDPYDIPCCQKFECMYRIGENDIDVPNTKNNLGAIKLFIFPILQ